MVSERSCEKSIDGTAHDNLCWRLIDTSYAIPYGPPLGVFGESGADGQKKDHTSALCSPACSMALDPLLSFLGDSLGLR